MTRGYGRYNITGGYGMIYPYYSHNDACSNENTSQRAPAVKTIPIDDALPCWDGVFDSHKLGQKSPGKLTVGP